MRHLLVVAYHFPPAGGVPVRRVLRLLRHLPEHGWRCSVLTAQRPYDPFHPEDPGELTQLPPVECVLRPPARAGPERTAAAGYRLLAGLARRLGRGRLGRGSATASGGLRRRLNDGWFFPDPKRWWVSGAVREGRALFSRDPFDGVLATGYPWSAFLVARGIRAATGCPMALDYRDDWTGNPRRLWSTPRHLALERSLLRSSQLVTAATDGIRQALRARAGTGVPVETVTSGWDPAELPEPDPRLAGAPRLVLTYTGSFNDALPPSGADQSPYSLLQAVTRLGAPLRGSLRVRLVGRIPASYRRWIREQGLSELVEVEGPVTHRRALQHQLAADWLWLYVGDAPGTAGILTGKLVEYAGARRPVLALAPEESEAARAVGRHGLGRVVPPGDVAAIAAALERCIEEYLRSGRPPDLPPSEPLSASRQVERWAALLHEAVAQPGSKPTS